MGLSRRSFMVFHGFMVFHDGLSWSFMGPRSFMVVHDGLSPRSFTTVFQSSFMGLLRRSFMVFHGSKVFHGSLMVFHVGLSPRSFTTVFQSSFMGLSRRSFMVFHGSMVLHGLSWVFHGLGAVCGRRLPSIYNGSSNITVLPLSLRYFTGQTKISLGHMPQISPPSFETQKKGDGNTRGVAGVGTSVLHAWLLGTPLEDSIPTLHRPYYTAPIAVWAAPHHLLRD